MGGRGSASGRTAPKPAVPKPAPAPQVAPQAMPQPQTAPQPFARAQRNASGMTVDQFAALPASQQATMINNALRQNVPDHLNNTSDLQKVMYALGVGGQPEVVSDSQLSKMQGTEMYRTVNSLYNSKTDINLTATQMADSLAKSRQTYVASNSTGGAAYGEGIYFATRRSDSTSYGNVTGDISKTAVVRAKMKPGTKTISYSSAASKANSEVTRGTQLGKAMKGMSTPARASVYAISNGYQALTSGHSYVNVIDRSCLVISDKYTAK